MTRKHPFPLPRRTPAGSSRRRPAGLDFVRDPDRAVSLFDPIRRRILEMLTEPDSASGLAKRLRRHRQTVSYHMRELLRAQLVIPAGRRRRRRFYDQCYVASARAYVLSPEVLGKLAADPRHAHDRISASYLLTLASQLQRELGYAMQRAGEAGKRLSTLTINTELRFMSPEQRTQFASELERAVVDVVGRHSDPFRNADGTPGEGRAYRLVVGCYPIPAERAAPGKAD